jgi:hypothetical protein
LLIAFDNRNRTLIFQSPNGGNQQGGFPRTGTGNQIQGKNAMLLKISPILRRIAIVFTQQILFDFNQSFWADFVVMMFVLVIMRVVMMVRMLCMFIDLAAAANTAHVNSPNKPTNL